nr:threonine--tRNA ligase [Candidatus Magasanikbacteria bacterium]
MENEQLSQLRHSAAHLLAAAVEAIYPEAKRTLGPPIDTGFYYDFDNLKITDHDLTAIENKMRELVKGWTDFSRQEVSKAEALDVFKTNEYKQELINEFSGEGSQLTLYTCGGFTDLCRGGHTENPRKELKHFKLLSVAGAYW